MKYEKRSGSEEGEDEEEQRAGEDDWDAGPRAASDAELAGGRLSDL